MIFEQEDVTVCASSLGTHSNQIQSAEQAAVSMKQGRDAMNNQNTKLQEIFAKDTLLKNALVKASRDHKVL